MRSNKSTDLLSLKPSDPSGSPKSRHSHSGRVRGVSKSTALDSVIKEQVLRSLLAENPQEVLRRAIFTLRAAARTGCVKSIGALQSAQIAVEPAIKPQGGKRANAPGVRWAKLMKRCVAGVRDGKAVIDNRFLRELCMAAPSHPGCGVQAFDPWFKAAEGLHCLMILNRPPSDETWDEDIREALEADESLQALAASAASGEKKPWRLIRARLRESARQHW